MFGKNLLKNGRACVGQGNCRSDMKETLHSLKNVLSKPQGTIEVK
jgi:hypothetical protein